MRRRSGVRGEEGPGGRAPAKATLERRAREARKKAAEKTSAAAAAAAAEEMDASGSAVGKGKGEASAASAASVEAEVEVKDWSQQKRARQAQLGGSVKKVNPSKGFNWRCVWQLPCWREARPLAHERRAANP